MMIPLPKFLLGYLLLAIGVVWYLAEGIWLSQRPTVEGKIISLAAEQEEKTTYYRSTFEYRVGDQVYAVADTVRSSPPIHTIGETVSVRYDEKNPQNGSIATWFRSFGMPLIFIVAGLVLIAIQYVISAIYNFVIKAIRQQVT